MKLLFRAFINAVLITSILLGIMPPIVQAANVYNYSLQITITENSGVARTNLPIVTGINITNLINTGYLNAAGSNNALVGSSPNGNAVPYMLKNDNLYFYIDTLAAFQTRVYYLLLQNTPNQTQYQIVIGDNKTENITVTGNSSLVLGNDFGFTYSGITDTTTNNSLFNQQSSLNVSTVSNGNITASITKNPTVASVNATTIDPASATWTVGLPAGIQSGDLLITTLGFAKGLTASFLPGWTQLTHAVAGSNADLDVWYKTANTSEGTSMGVNISGGGSPGGAIVYRIINWNQVTPKVNPTATGVGINPTASSFAPNFTSNISTLWIETTSISTGGLSVNVTGYPTGTINGTYVGSSVAQIYGVATSYNITTTSNLSAGIFTLDTASDWVAQTIAISSTQLLLTTSVTAIGHNVTSNLSSGNFSLSIDGVMQASTNTSINITSLSNIIIQPAPSSDNITLSINGTQVILYRPNAIVSGNLLPDLSNNGHTGIINYGVNPNGIIVTIGQLTPTTQLSPGAVFTGGTNVIQQDKIPANWYATNTGLTALPFYGTFNDKSTEMGMTTQTLYFMLLMAIVSAIGLGIGLFTGSSLLVIIGMCFAMGTGVGMTIAGGWMIFAFILMAGGIWYLSRRG